MKSQYQYSIKTWFQLLLLTIKKHIIIKHNSKIKGTMLYLTQYGKLIAANFNLSDDSVKNKHFEDELQLLHTYWTNEKEIPKNVFRSF